ncbi:MAG: hypothetical protein QM756_45990 [Polyangiaceae bacterium]
MAPDDALNLRCWDQKRRFGFDLLHPVSRYIEGLTRSQVQTSYDTGEFKPNPLFAAGSQRKASMVFLAGIVGVPWQDLATTDSLTSTSLTYLSHAQLVSEGRWKLILGDPGTASQSPNLPGDKLMFETYVDRSTQFGNALHPLIGAAGALAPATSTGLTNVINGHETNNPDRDDLQYACIFPLPTARQCTSTPCECDVGAADRNRPQCQGTTQVYAKANPSVRELQVLKGVGDVTGNAITTSICAKQMDSADRETFGYVPAMSAILSALKPALK